ncbi:MAG TPA: DUF1684 domain-containing protein [Thermoanaerobaculia bacterium]|nr:DUF1684 domain-containing protein [Thermoanaerobaculia bacterium]
MTSPYPAQIESWRQRRIARLTAPDGWLSVVGLFWLEDGENSVGSATGSRVALPARAPASVGTIRLEAGRAAFRPSAGVSVLVDGKPPAATAVVLGPDAEGTPTVVETGGLSFYLIARQDRLAVRVKDPDSEARRAFRGITSFPIDPSWRIEARVEQGAAPTPIAIPNVLGKETSEPSPGTLVFERAGKTYRLTPVLEQGETDWFVIFADGTNGRETYGAGRFLYVSPAKDGKTVIDFNKAYNPPCVFTDYATCPLPPALNRLPIRVEAGEKDYAHGETR